MLPWTFSIHQDARQCAGCIYLAFYGIHMPILGIFLAKPAFCSISPYKSRERKAEMQNLEKEIDIEANCWGYEGA